MDPRELYHKPRIFSFFPKLKPGEHFKVNGYAGEFWFDKEGFLQVSSNNMLSYRFDMLTDILNDPGEIIYLPQWDKDEIFLMRAFFTHGYDYWQRMDDGALWASKNQFNSNFHVPDYSHHIDNEFLPHLLPGQTVDVAKVLKADANHAD